MNKNTISRAFTLIELLVVISVIGVLSSVVMAALSNARDKGTIGAAQNFDGHTYAAFYDDLVAAWDFNNDSGTTARDQSGNGNDLTLNALFASISNAQNPFINGKTLLINPDTSLTPAVTAPVLKYSNTTMTNFSVSFWLRTIDAPVAPSMNVDLVSNSWANSEGKWKFAMQNGNLVFTYRDSSSLKSASLLLPSTNKWYQVVGVCNGTKGGLYVNGKLYDTGSMTGMSQCNFLNNINDTIKFATSAGTSYSFFMDNVRIYKMPLPISAIQEIYLAESQKYEILAKNNR